MLALLEVLARTQARLATALGMADVSMRAAADARVHARLSACTRTHAHTHACTHAHTHTHMHVQSSLCASELRPEQCLSSNPVVLVEDSMLRSWHCDGDQVDLARSLVAAERDVRLGLAAQRLARPLRLWSATATFADDPASRRLIQRVIAAVSQSQMPERECAASVFVRVAARDSTAPLFTAQAS